MAARHAGFALVACVGEDLINNLVEAAFLVHPQHRSVQLPVPLAAPAGAVTVDGDVTLLPPTVTLTGGQVQLGVRVLVEARLSSPAAAPADVAVELSSLTSAGLAVTVVDDRLQVGIDPLSVTVSGLTLRVVDGSLPSLYGQALQLPQVAAAIQAAVRGLPPHLLRTTVDGFPLTAHIAPRQMPCGASLFELPEMFHATFSISRVFPSVHEHVLVIGVDIAGVTNGDPAALRPLFGDVRPAWVRTSDPDGPVDFKPVAFRPAGNVAVSLNPDALDGLLRGPISSASHHAFVDCHVALDGLSVQAETFTPPLRPQHRIDGLRFRVGARYYQSTARDAQSRLVPAGDGTPVSVGVPIAVHLQTWDGPTDFLSGKADYWYLQTYEPDIELPWWAPIGLFLLGMALPTSFVPAVALVDGVLPSVLGNVTEQVRRNAQAGVSGAWTSFGLGAVSRTIQVPGLEAVPASLTGIRHALDGQGIDVYATLALASRPDTRPDRNLTVTMNGTKVRDGMTWQTFARALIPFRFAVAIKPGAVDPFDLDVRVRWELRRSDTKAVLVTKDLPRGSVLRGVGDPDDGPMRLLVDRSDPALAAVPGFEVSLRVYRPLQGRTKEIGSATFGIEIMDRLDRSRPYVWWSGWAVGSPKESVLHRTATPGRCLMVERAPQRTTFQYVDELPFPVAELHLHRGGTVADRRSEIVCDYCFFGGPDKDVPLI